MAGKAYRQMARRQAAGQQVCRVIDHPLLRYEDVDVLERKLFTIYQTCAHMESRHQVHQLATEVTRRVLCRNGRVTPLYRRFYLQQISLHNRPSFHPSTSCLPIGLCPLNTCVLSR